MRKKNFFAALVIMIAVVSCTGVPLNPEDIQTLPEIAEDVASKLPDTGFMEEIAPEELEIDEPEINEPEIDEFDIDDTEIDEPDREEDEVASLYTDADDREEPEWDESVLADAGFPAEEDGFPGEEPPEEGDLLAEWQELDEPEPPAEAVLEMEPEPQFPPPPPVTQVPVTPPPSAAPPPAMPPPVMPPPAPPPPVVAPSVAEEPSAVVDEPAPGGPVPGIIPELPNPTPAFRGRQEDEVVFSRMVRATAGQLVVVPFRGTGWVYLGEAGARRGIAYDSRRLDPEGQSFIFRTETPGEYILKFYRQDFIRDFILNDYVQVIVGDPPETAGAGWFNPSIDRGRVIAEPRWPASLEEARSLRADTQPSRPAPPADLPATPSTAPPATPAPAPVQPPAQTPPASIPAQPPAQTPPVQTPAEQTPPVQVPALDPDEYLQRAREEFDAGRIAEAIAFLNRLRDFYPVESDEVLWLYGQFYEANSPSRNILTALDYYRRLTQEYPQSGRYDAARRRIAYLQRYYINIH